MRIEKIGKYTVRVYTSDDTESFPITSEDRELDKRVKKAVSSAIKDAKACKKPVAKYDSRKKKAYVESNGVKEYVN